MSVRWVIEHKDGGKFLSPYGWVTDKTHAMSFGSSDDVEEHMARNYRDQGHLPAHYDEMLTEADPQVEREYDPFGVRR